MRRSLAVFPVLLAILTGGCHVTIVSSPRPASDLAAADSIPADSADVDDGLATPPVRPYRPPPPAPALPRLVIQAPAQWAGTARDTVTIGVREPLTVTGLLHHLEPVQGIRVNGQAATIAGYRDGVTRFAATFEPANAGVMAVRVEARTAEGHAVATYYVNATPRTATRGTRTQPTPRVTPPVTPPTDPDTTMGPPPPPPTDPDTTIAPPPPSAADSAWAQRARWAVVIGVSNYVDDAIPARQFATRDAHAINDFLRSPAAGPGGIPAGRRLLLADAQATRTHVQRALTSFLSDVGPEDVVLVFLAATALPDPDRPNGAYLLPHDARPGDLATTALTVQWLTEALGEVHAHQKIVFADILQAPGQPRGGGRGAERGAPTTQNLVHRALESAGPRDRSLVVLTAVGAGNTPAQEGAQWGGGHGAFSHYLLAGLRGAADGNGDRIVTLSELLQHTRDAVRRGTSNAQNPGLSAASYDREWPMARVIER